MTNPIIEAMARAMAVRVGLNPTSKAFGPWMEDAKAAYLAALPMIVEDFVGVVERTNGIDHVPNWPIDGAEIAQAIRALAAAKVEELSRG